MQSNTGQLIRSLDQKPYESHYLHVETIIDHPVEKVWPCALNIGSWMSAHRLETIAGEPMNVGHFERVYPRNLGAEVPPPHYHLYGIAEIIPLKLIALEVLPEKGGSYGDAHEWVSFDNILLSDIGAKTQVTFLMVEIQLGKWDQRSRENRNAVLEGVRPMLEGYFENLKRLVERGC
jgi:hypothetical protein